MNVVMERASNPFVLWFKGRNVTHVEELVNQIVSIFTEANPHTVLTVVFEFVEPAPPSFLSNLLETSSNPHTYINKAFFPLYQEGEIISPNFLVIAPLNQSTEIRDRTEGEYQALARVVWSCDLEGISNHETPGTTLILSGRVPQDPSSRFRLLKILGKISNSRPEEILFRREDAQSWWNQEARELRESALFKESILVT